MLSMCCQGHVNQHFMLTLDSMYYTDDIFTRLENDRMDQ